MSNKLNSQFLQSFIIVFFMTVISNIIYNHSTYLYKKITRSFLTKEITPTVAQDIQTIIQKEIVQDTDDPVAVFFYQNNYTSRIRFDSTTFVLSPVINDLSQDPEYSNMLGYHLFGLCYEQNIASMDKDSYLYDAYLNLEKSLFPAYYTSCPIFVEEKLIGYIGSFYNLNDITRPSIRISRLKHLSKVTSKLLDPYF